MELPEHVFLHFFSLAVELYSLLCTEQLQSPTTWATWSLPDTERQGPGLASHGRAVPCQGSATRFAIFLISSVCPTSSSTCAFWSPRFCKSLLPNLTFNQSVIRGNPFKWVKLCLLFQWEKFLSKPIHVRTKSSGCWEPFSLREARATNISSRLWKKGYDS